MNTQHTLAINIHVPQELVVAGAAHPDQILKRISDMDTKRVQGYVVDQLSDSDGGPELIDLHIGKFQYDKESGTGSFRLHFKVSRRFCCADSTGCNDDYIDFRYVYREEVLYAEGHYFQWTLNN
ncbi:hypothetical protein [Sphingobacterium paludis]|uniref:Uncharacterized protein n=1 Tax=Sphingobacterium paludis TaxID=1476465 RepID=A0A4R7CX95_9SPHI|nr:hypothetical protein [Sphingobacterium paludis]TDS12900.1 hypothetical protein B0I21_10531 [Sphingobacterium paludis]